MTTPVAGAAFSILQQYFQMWTFFYYLRDFISDDKYSICYIVCKFFSEGNTVFLRKNSYLSGLPASGNKKVQTADCRPKLSPRGDSCNVGGCFAGGEWGVLNLRRRVFFYTTRKSFFENRGEKSWIQMFFIRFFWGLVSV